MQKLRQIILFPSLLLFALLSGCSGGGGSSSTPPPPPGKVTITVVDDQAVAIADAQIQVFDASTGNPIATLTSGADGIVSASYYEDNIQLKVSAQGYAPSPAPGVPALPIALLSGQTEAVTITLQGLDPLLKIGTISGMVLDQNGLPVVGALVTANDVTSTHSGADGGYTLYNVAEGDVSLTAWIVGLNFPTVGPVALLDGDNLTQDLTASGAATGTVTGNLSVVAAGSVYSGDPIDVTLLHQGSREVIPGLRDFTTSNFNITHVPNGTFDVIASLENDGLVLDPDTSVTQGIPTATINNNTFDMGTLKVTGGVILTNPTPTNFAFPLPELSATPTFAWDASSAYSSVDTYAIEVLDESSNTIWGGFDISGLPTVTVPKSQRTIGYDSDGTATAVLEPGKVYQLKVYARDNGGVYLSASETLDGLFRIATPAP